MNTQPRPAEFFAGDVSAAFRTAMRHLAGAVSVVTVGNGAARTGLTATSVSSFSIEPPTIVVAVNRASSSWPAIRHHSAFCVNVLGEHQRQVAENFAGRDGAKGNERYGGAEWTTLATGAPVLLGALATIDCELDEAIERHSHALVFGQVKAVLASPSARPLLYWRGDFLQAAAERLPNI